MNNKINKSMNCNTKKSYKQYYLTIVNRGKTSNDFKIKQY